MSTAQVWPAMARAFEPSKGDLADRLLTALNAAQAAGGDVRGKQSASLVIVRGKATGKSWVDREFDLRVDDSPDPLKELGRLVVLQRAYNHMNAGDLAVEDKDDAQALAQYSAASALAPANVEMVYWHAVALVKMGRVSESLPLFRRVFTSDPNWIGLTSRIAAAGLLPADRNVIDEILRQARPGK
jgi:uncharacterized Ntn-hydrolase superfamily protein